MLVEVKHGNKSYKVEVPEGGTLKDLKDAIAEASGILPPLQKLLGKPNLQTKPDTTPLAELGIKDKTKLMLIGSAAADVVKANAPSAEEKVKEVERQKLLRNLPQDFWLLGGYTGFLADPYISGKNSLENSTRWLSLLSLDVVLSRINTLGAGGQSGGPTSAKILEALGQNAASAVSHKFLTALTSTQRTAVQKAHTVVRACYNFTLDASQATDPAAVLQVVDKAIQLIDALPVGEWLMIPSGWEGMNTSNTVYLLLKRTAAEKYNLVVVNRGKEGQEYHPHWQTADKVKTCPFLHFESIAPSRLTDKSFWLLLLSLWMRSNDPRNASEFVRGEVFYDVLLPWLVEANPPHIDVADVQRRFTTEMVLSNDLSTSDFATKHLCSPACSNSSSIKSAISAFCFLLEQYGTFTVKDVKQLKFVLKYEFFIRAAEDIGEYARRFVPIQAGVSTPSDATSHPQRRQGQLQPAAATAVAAPAPAMNVSNALANSLALLEKAGVSLNSSEFTFADVMNNAKSTGTIIKTAKNVILSQDTFQNKMVLLYIGTLKSKGGKQFAAQFARTADAILSRSKDLPFGVEIVFLSVDNAQSMYDEHISLFSFHRSSFPGVDLANTLDVLQLPEVLVFLPDGTLAHRKGVAAVRADPEAETFPGGVWKGEAPLSATDVRMIECGAAQLAHHTQKRFEAGEVSSSVVDDVLGVIHATLEVLQQLPADDLHDIARVTTATASGKTNNHADEKEATLALNNGVTQTLSPLEDCYFFHGELLPQASTVAYHGRSFRSSVPDIEEIHRFTVPHSYAELELVMSKGRKVVETLWSRARSSGTASRVAVQLHIIEFITWLFSRIVPVPLPPASACDASEVPPVEHPHVAQFYYTDSFPAHGGNGGGGGGGAGNDDADAETADAQLNIMRAVHYFALSYGNAWQAVETPSRSFDAERCLIAMHMLLVFDAVARQENGSKQGALMASLLNSCGYYPSTTLGRQGYTFARVAATLELTRPHLLLVRSAVLRYIGYLQQHLHHELFDLRMPDKLEIRKGSHTVDFLRAFLDNAGFPLTGSGSPMLGGGSEMDLLMDWMCSNRTPLAQKHAEFSMLRDMVLLAKFMGTMEMRDAQLLHRRKEADPLASWRICFEEDTPGRQMSAGWRTRPSAPRWECVMVRGRDMDIADIVVKGFGDRELHYGDGLVLQSPIDVSRLIEVDHPSEDDVLHARSLPSLGGTMSAEESEELLSCLTAPYIRIPLILDFFASQDRNTYLFVREVQEVLRAVLFEPAAYITAAELRSHDPRSVPMRLNAQQRAEIELMNLRGVHQRRNDEACLGTTHGLLLNELVHAPAMVLHPLRTILETIAELGPSSVYSPNASYVLFIVGLVCDVLEYCRFAKEVGGPTPLAQLVAEFHAHYLRFLRGTVLPLLSEWCAESERNTDTPTQCVLHAYKSMIDRALWKSKANGDTTAIAHDNIDDGDDVEAREASLVGMLCSCAFVRARHGFGMGMQRTQLAAQEGDDVLSPEEKMLRFLQAQGLDTSRVSRELLEQGKQLMMSGGRRRAVFVQIRSRFYNDTVRVPNLFHSDAKSTTESKLLKLPPADVPENVLFRFMLDDHVRVIDYLTGLSPPERSCVFEQVLKTVVRGSAPDGTEAAMPSMPSVRASVADLAAASSGEVQEERHHFWRTVSPGVYKGPRSSGLLFHAQTCELFWRSSELKPVPDTMSHFADFESILGKEILQCGLVSRREHRHWVHIVGTPYDVVEWTAPPDPRDLGVHCPLILVGDNWPSKMIESARFMGVVYDRIVEVGTEEPWPVPEERWAVDMLRATLEAAYPEGMKFFPLAPALPEDEEGVAAASSPSSSSAPKHHEVMRFLMNDGPQYEDEQERATWKEVVAYRYPQPHFVVFNLVTHARKMYRSLVFTSNQRFCLHSLSLLPGARTRGTLRTNAFMAGELKRRIQNEGSLEIYRFNRLVGGREVYVPARLLQGVIPSVLLETFLFWQGDDDILRGYAPPEEGEVESEREGQREGKAAGAREEQGQPRKNKSAEMMDHWFNYSVEVHLLPRSERRDGSGDDAGDGEGAMRCVIVRRNDVSYTPIETDADSNAGELVRRESGDSAADTVSRAGVLLVHSALSHLSQRVCKQVLVLSGGDVSAAVQWATDAENQEALQAMVDEDAAAGSGGGGGRAVRAPLSSHMLRPTDLVLVNLVRFPKLSALLELFVALEDPSHILVWAERVASPPADKRSNSSYSALQINDGGCLLQIQSIELPRLRAKFSTQMDSHGTRARLFLVDQPGWRVAEPDDFTEEGRRALRALRDPFQQCMLLANSSREVALLVPNHDFRPMDVSDDPFNALLLFDRSSYAWQESVPSPFYLYVVHPSYAFLMPPTLSASLYHAVMQCATQHYAAALRSLEACYTDSPFSPEEAYMFALFARTLGDRFPDAHAVRLKLAHAVQYSANALEWDLSEEVAGYLCKKRHVSKDCQLTRAEVVDLLKRCPKALPMVRSQLELYAGLLKSRDAAGEGESAGAGAAASTHALVQLKTPALDRCGFPWERLLLYPWERISPQKLKRVTYGFVAADALKDAALIEFLFKDTLLQDEEGGSNTKTGFYLLYCMLKGAVRVSLQEKDITGSFAEMMSRWFHLRHARWGREAQGAGESEVAPSWCATVLQLMLQHPTAAWPPVADGSERYVLSQGVNLANRQLDANPFEENNGRRPSQLPQHFDRMNTVARELFTRNERTARTREARVASQQRTPAQRSHAVDMFDHIVPRLMAGDTARAELALAEQQLSLAYFGGDAARRRATLRSLCTEPLSELGLHDTVIVTRNRSATENEENEGEEETESSYLPLSKLRRHPAARAPLAQNMLDRLEEDTRRFEQQQQKTMSFEFQCLAAPVVHSMLYSDASGSDADDVVRSFDGAREVLLSCVERLHRLNARNAAATARVSESILSLTNSDKDSSAPEERQGEVLAVYQEHRLRRFEKSRTPLTVEWLCGALLSTQFAQELSASNPFHGSVVRIQSEIMLLMLLSNQGYFAEQGAAAVEQVLLFLELCRLLRVQGTREGSEADGRSRAEKLVKHFSVEITSEMLGAVFDSSSSSTAGGCRVLPAAVADILAGRLRQLTSAALDVLTARRFYMESVGTGSGEDGEGGGLLTYAVDPRFLLFEFLFNILLRERQVEMVRWFVANTLQGQSRVQQMIMGQGKTTVVGPLLALILADGTQLVTQVMPTALLEQTRGILRRCFSVVVVKHIYTLQFDRSNDSDLGDGGVELLYQKLKAAEEDRSVVIAAPECIKSLFLKNIEQLHMVESTSNEDLNKEHDADERYAAHAHSLRKRLTARAVMADHITPILQLWKRGVLIMDEVDVLLHPLRSELNFPIGLKHPIDMSGPRWLLPIHMLDGVFYFTAGRATDDVRLMLKRAATTAVVSLSEDSATAVGDANDEEEKEEEGEGRRERELLSHIRAAIQKGYAERALQREPHMVLLDRHFYDTDLLGPLLAWTQLWLHRDMMDRLTEEEVRQGAPLGSFEAYQACTGLFLRDATKQVLVQDPALAGRLSESLSAYDIQLLNLAHDWLHRILPHVLAKIDRVSFGILQPADISLRGLALGGGDGKMPFTRLTMAVPFVAKDVPSRSSEFAHPDVVIGLTILAYRYEGLREKDVRDLIVQLKKDFARQVGPKDHRPAARLYRRWLHLASLGAGPHTAPQEPRATVERAGVPLSQLQATDRAQMRSLHEMLRRVPEVVHYHLCSSIFPRAMNFQRLKVSACGHELGSSMLFTKRIGFSGTPSNLLPLDLGECFYEPGSDGRVLSVLTNPAVAAVEELPADWTPLSVLERVATAQPPFAALIDAGALITNMDNEDVARHLMQRLPASLYDGVVFLDSGDRQMILQRDNGLTVPVAQCGVPLSRRFTFFDQVHTTGTDVKQSATATAAITLGKDLVFRDYAQAAYRMRGIGKGQRLCLYLIPEVVARIRTTLTPEFETGDRLKDVPQWLLLNSMSMEGLQFFKLSLQELANVWRKKAIHNLVAESAYANAKAGLYTGFMRARRFHIPHRAPDAEGQAGLPSVDLLRESIAEFRETIEYPVAPTLAPPVAFLDHIQDILRGKSTELIAGDAHSQALVQQLLGRMEQTARATRATTEAAGPDGNNNTTDDGAAFRTMDLNAEIVHEQEAEEEQEQEAEQEEQRVSAFSRDDEAQIPWAVETLRRCGSDASKTARPTDGSCFYQLSRFRIRAEQPCLAVDPTLLLSDNYFRLEWHGVGERRLKSAFLFLEWVPSASEEDERDSKRSRTEKEASEACGGASAAEGPQLCAGLVTLAEGESLRWMMHHSGFVREELSAALRFVNSGHYMEATRPFQHLWRGNGSRRLSQLAALTTAARAPSLGSPSSFSSSGSRQKRPRADPVLDGAALLFRFFNNDMFFTDDQLDVLETVLSAVDPESRLRFFSECLRVRRRLRNHWEDAPIARLFVSSAERPFIKQVALVGTVRRALEEKLHVLCELATLPPGRVTAARREEATQIEDHFNAFAVAIAHLDSGSHARGNEEEEGAGGGSLVPAVVARSVLESFPQSFRALSTHDMEQALVYAVHRHHSEAFPSPAAVKCFTAGQLFEAFPLLSLAHIQGVLAAEARRRAETAPRRERQEPWACPACTFLNEPFTRLCVMCTTPRPGGGTHGDGDDDGDEDEVDGPWQCEVCTLLNESRAQDCCSVCLAPNPHPLKRRAAAAVAGAAADWDCPEGYWVCSVEHGGCSKFNANSLFYCQVCEKARPNLASVRF